MKARLCTLAALMLLAACGPAENNDNNTTSNNTTSNNTTSNNTTSNNTTSNNTTSNNTTSNNTTANNTTANNTANNTAGNNTTGGAPSFSTEIVPIISGSCAIAGCHAAPGNKDFAVDDPADAANVQAALDGVDSAAVGIPLIDPGAPNNSEIFLRISGMARTQMPLGGALDQADIDTIEAWIAAGAPYDN